MKLIPNWREAWRFLSIQMIALASIWESIPEDVKASVVAPDWQNRVTFALIVAAGLGRMIDQSGAK